MPKTTVAAIDLGATSGRVIVGEITAGGVELTEVHRFPNAFSTVGNNNYWDVGALFSETCKGLSQAKSLYPELRSCGVDTWGVDHAICSMEGRLVFPVHAYRDERTNPLLEKIRSEGMERKLFDLTGLPLINYNTGIQLAESLQSFPGLKDVGEKVFLLPELIGFLLSGTYGPEFSHASTTQLLDVNGLNYSEEALKYFNIPSDWMTPPKAAGSSLGNVISVDGCEDVATALVPGHDTSCAFEVIPSDGNSLLISSGTWMLVGSITDVPCLGDEAFELGISNERTGQGLYRPNKIILGLWLLEQTIPFFDKRPSNDAEWSALISAADEKPEPEVLIDTSDSALFNPKNMREAIEAQIIGRGGKAPEDLPAFLQLICCSLASSIKSTADKFENILSKKFDNIVIVGGGSKNALLCQKIANAAGLPVTSYSLEAASLGNMAYQLIALGKIPSMSAFHEIIKPTLNSRTYSPRG